MYLEHFCIYLYLFWSRHPEGEVPARTALTPSSSVRTKRCKHLAERGQGACGARPKKRALRGAAGRGPSRAQERGVRRVRPAGRLSRPARHHRPAPRGRLKPASWRAGRRTARKPQPPSQPPPGDRGGRWQRSRIRSDRSVVARVIRRRARYFEFRRLAHDG